MKFKDWYKKDLSNTFFKGDIDCSNTSISSLEGSPFIIEGDFNCSNTQITSLKYLPKYIKGDLYVYDCYQLINFEIESIIDGNIYYR